MDWEAIREDYPILQRNTYLNSCSLGALSTDAMEASRTFQEQWSTRGAAAWYDWWLAEIKDWRQNVATLLQCSPEEIAWGPSVSALVGSIASGLSRRNPERGDVVAFEQEFPTVVSCWGTRPDTTMKHVPGNGVTVDVDAYDAACGEQTRALVASRVFYNSGAIQDVKALSGVARKHGAVSVIEDYHGTGQLQADVKDWGADVVVGGALKWLCGGMGSCFAYVRKDLIKELEPQHSGWWANATMFDFDNTDFQFWDDARRFEGGEVNMPGLVVANAAQKKLLDIGIDRIQSRNLDLQHDLLDRLADAGHIVRVEDRAAHSALIMVERENPKEDVARLEKDNGIIVDDRPGCVRVSPHFYNTFEENEAFVAALR